MIESSRSTSSSIRMEVTTFNSHRSDNEGDRQRPRDEHVSESRIYETKSPMDSAPRTKRNRRGRMQREFRRLKVRIIYELIIILILCILRKVACMKKLEISRMLRPRRTRISSERTKRLPTDTRNKKKNKKSSNGTHVR